MHLPLDVYPILLAALCLFVAAILYARVARGATNITSVFALNSTANAFVGFGMLLIAIGTLMRSLGL